MEGFDDEVMQIFMNYSWPGNLREFRNVIRRAALLTQAGRVNPSVLPSEIISNILQKHEPDHYVSEHSHHEHNNLNREVDLKNSAAQAEYNVIMNVLKQVNFNKTKAAEILKIDRKTLYNKIKAYQLD